MSIKVEKTDKTIATEVLPEIFPVPVTLKALPSSLGATDTVETLAETLVALTGKHHGEDEESRELGLRIIQFLRKKVDEFTEETHLNWSCYATPAEGLSGKFIKRLI